MHFEIVADEVLHLAYQHGVVAVAAGIARSDALAAGDDAYAFFKQQMMEVMQALRVWWCRRGQREPVVQHQDAIEDIAALSLAVAGNRDIELDAGMFGTVAAQVIGIDI